MRAEIFQQFFVGDCGFIHSLIKRCKVFLVFPKCQTNGLIHEIGHRTMGMDGFDAQGPVKGWIKIYCGTFCRFTHGAHLHTLPNILTL